MPTSPASATGVCSAASASRRAAACWAPCPVLQRDQPCPPRRCAAVEDPRPPVGGRPRGVAVGDAQPAQGCGGRRLLVEGPPLGDDDGGSPRCRDVGDGVLAAVRDHDISSAQLGPQVGRRPGRAASVQVHPGVGASGGCDGCRVDVPPAGTPQEQDLSSCRVRRRPRARPAVEAGQPTHAPRLARPGCRPVPACVRAPATGPGARRPRRTRPGARGRYAHPGARRPPPGSHTAGPAAPPPRRRRRPSADGRSRAIHELTVAIRSPRPRWCRGAQCSTPPAVTSSSAGPWGRRRGQAAPTRRASPRASAAS